MASKEHKPSKPEPTEEYKRFHEGVKRLFSVTKEDYDRAMKEREEQEKRKPKKH